MSPMSTYKLVLRRLADDWKLLLSILVGITVAASLVAGAPVYIRTLERQGIDTAIDRASQSFLNLFAFAPYITLSRSQIEASDRAIDDAVGDNIASIYRGRERYMKTATFLVDAAGQSPVSRRGNRITEPAGEVPLQDERVSRGYFQQLTHLADHVTLLSGRMAVDQVVPSRGGPTVEAIVGDQIAGVFGLAVGDRVIMTPSLNDPIRVEVEIVGIVEATDTSEEYWQGNAGVFLRPAPLDEVPDPDVEVEPDEPPLALFITREAMIEGVGKAYPGRLVSSNWFIFIDKENLKAWSMKEARARLDGMESDISNKLQGSAVFTGVDNILDDFEQRSFFASVPLLLLLVLMVITVLHYVAMMVSYLVRSREDDVALLRSRGVSPWQLLRLYSVEGLLLALTATVVAPLLAMGTVAAAGKLGYFSQITLGETLPVAFHWLPFVAAAGTGLLSLAIFVVPGVMGARAGLVAHKLRSSRPPSTPLFQRYYLDISLLALGGLIFWELVSRGQLISGGLFSSVQVNEALLMAPVLLLTVVALLFMRFFPMLVRYLSGESAALLHLVAVATLSTLALTVAVRELRAGTGLGWLWEVVLIGVIGVLYYATQRSGRMSSLVTGLAVQTGLIGLLILSEVPGRDQVSYVPTVVAALLVPLELVFLLLRRIARTYPVWASMAIWHLARRPLQYSWLVLLLVMVTGLAVLATTVGGTLDRSNKERIYYEVGADLRVTDVEQYFSRGLDNLKRSYQEIPGVTSLSLALRAGGVVGRNYSGNQFSMLAVESKDFRYITWYRDDFSEQPLSGVMSALQSQDRVALVEIPLGARALRVWAKPEDAYLNMFLWAVVQDKWGVMRTLSFGEMGPPDWTLMQTEIPRYLNGPLSLVSLQIFEPVFGPAGTPGTILLDDIHVTFEGDRKNHVIDDFEGPNKWTTLATSVISSDSIGATPDGALNGRRAGKFSFGKDTDQGIRGFFRSPNSGPMPVVSSNTFARATGTDIGDTLLISVMGRLVPIRITETVDFFPTLDPANSGFLVVDLESVITHLNVMNPSRAVGPNELFLATVPSARAAVYQGALSLAPSRNSVHDRQTLLDSVRLDPLVTAGWRAMVLVAIGVILFTAIMGYIAYLLTFSTESRNEMGFLRALGFSARQMIWLVSAEHLVIVVIGLATGTLAGFAMSNILVSAVAVTERGQPVLPPFVITTDWALMGPIYLALIAVFVTALYWLTRVASRADLSEITRVEGE